MATRLSSNLVVVFIAQAVGLVVAGGVVLGSGEPMPSSEALLWAALAGVVASIALATFYLALSRGTMGLVAPLTALIAATIPALVGLLSGEVVEPLVLLGMAVALVAVVIISLPDERLGPPRLATFHGSRASEWLLIIVAGLGFAFFYLFVDVSHESGGEVWWPLFMLKAGAIVAITLTAALLVPLGRFAAVRLGSAALVLSVLAGLGDLGGNLFFILASAEGGLAVVVVLVSLYPVATVVLARVVLHERLARQRLVGVALAVTGVVLIGIGSL